MTQSDPLVDELLAVPEAPPLAPRRAKVEDFTKRVEVSGDVVETEIRRPAFVEDEPEGEARDLLTEHGLDPADFIVTGFRSSTWTMANGEEGISRRFTFARRGSAAAAEHERPPIDELVAAVKVQGGPVSYVRPKGDHAYVVALGDMQFGKIDGDGVEGTLRRAIKYIDRAVDLLAFYRQRFDIGHVHIAWLGDHIEGFQSQGGANVWRTPLTLSEQIRLTRRVMLHAVQSFAPLAERVTVAAVPGNHGETARFSGKGVTRYADSHDTEALVAVSEAVALDPERYGHVEFFVPTGDEMTVTVDLAGTVTGHAHGHQFRPGKHFEWWKGQAFGGSPLALAKLLLLGHLHHLHVEEEGDRMVVQVPSLESESTWWRHRTGTRGNPGIVVAITKDGKTGPIEVIR